MVHLGHLLAIPRLSLSNIYPDYHLANHYLGHYLAPSLPLPHPSVLIEKYIKTKL